MESTYIEEVISVFESSFADKCEIPQSLELQWLKIAIGKYSLELNNLSYDEETHKFDRILNQYEINTLGVMMLELYQAREVSKANKRVSIVGKDISIDGSNGTKTAEKAHLEYVSGQVREYIENQKPSALL